MAPSGTGTIGVGTAPLSPGDQANLLQARLLQIQGQLTSYNASLKSLTAQLKSTKSAHIKGMLQKQINDINSKISTATASQTSTQNNLYQVTGQYDKLLSGAGRDAYMALNTLFTNYGLGSLAGKIFDYVKNGYSSDTISILLQSTPEYQKRFAANAARQKAGMGVLSPAEYLATEDSYRQIMRASGLPTGFYDSTDDFTNFIAGDMSPTELQSRVDAATQATTLANPAYKQALQAMGLSQGDIAAYFLDPNKALPMIQKTAATAAIGAEALQRGLAFDQSYAGDLASEGVTRDQAAQGYAQIGQNLGELQTLGSVYGGGFTQRQAEEDVFTGGGAASQQKKRIVDQEKGTFSGSTGAAANAFSGTGGQR